MTVSFGATRAPGFSARLLLMYPIRMLNQPPAAVLPLQLAENAQLSISSQIPAMGSQQLQYSALYTAYAFCLKNSDLQAHASREP